MPIFRVRGIDVDFPFEAYDCQIVYMDKVIQALQEGCNALLESPTGTGKTLCLLCAALAWRKSLGPFSSEFQQEKLSQSSEDVSSSQRRSSYPCIIYASRTHSQLKQVIRELKASNYRPKMGILGSREQMCIHDKVKSQQGSTQNNACYYLRKKRSCRHHTLVSDYMKAHPELGNEPFDIEDLVNVGRTQGPCPYYMSRDLHKTVDILFCPYNYLIDPGKRDSLSGIQWDNAVLIFDEAHNLESVCADAASFDLPLRYLSACISEADECVSLAAKRRAIQKSAEHEHDPENYAILKALLLKLETRISEVVINSKESGFTRPGLYIYEFLAELNITFKTATMLTSTIESCVQLLEERHMNGYLNRMKGTICRLELVKDILKTIFRDGGKSHASYYRFHVHESHQNVTDSFKGAGKTTSRVLSWWCFHPGIAMREFVGLNVRSIIMTSGTLSPLDSFSSEMGIEFPIKLENPHVVSQNQVWVGVISSGPSGFSLNSSYRNRDSVDYKKDLGNAIVNFTRIVPDGLLVFFPSYFLMNQCIECWKNVSHSGSSGLSTIWERICKNKQPVVEPKESQLFGSSIDDFLTKLHDKSTSGAVFFAVCRGKVSEGLDFADRAGRAVVITGIPFAMMADPKIRLKRDFLDQQVSSQKDNLKALTGEEWYVQQATRAVNQAIGRVIRHRHDYGAIIFCDERFTLQSHQEKMSLWLRPHVKTYSKFGDVVFTLTRFFRDQVPRETMKELKKDDPLTGPSENVSIQDGPVRGSVTGKSEYVSIKDEEHEEISILSPPRPVINIPGKRGVFSKTTGPVSIDHVVPANKSTVSGLNNSSVDLKRKTVDSKECHVAKLAPCRVASLTKAAKIEAGGKKAAEQTKGSAFLEQVKEKLSEAEYKEFVGLMKALKMRKMGIVSVLDSIAGLFSLPGRYSLLQSFRDYVPSQYKLIYEKHLIGDQRGEEGAETSKGKK